MDDTEFLAILFPLACISAQKVPVFCSQRWILAYIGFLGFGVVYALRVNISVAVVCMLKTINTTESVTSVNESLPTDGCVTELAEASHSNDRADLEWSTDTKSAVLSSFFYGYIVTQVPGGWLADRGCLSWHDATWICIRPPITKAWLIYFESLNFFNRYGGKRVLLTSLSLSSFLTILFPVCARTSIYLVYAIRVSLGLLTAVTFPAMHAMWGRWAPPLERSKLTALCYAGTTLGNVVTFSTSGLLCAYGFDNGWGSIFYVTGGVGILWSMAWFFIAADRPSLHPRITESERKFITSSIEYRTDRKTVRVPWVQMFKSPCLWAVVSAHVCNNWTNYTLLTNIPTFMKEVLKFDIKSNGALSAVPYVCQFLSAILGGQLADRLRSKQILSTTHTRKSFQGIASFGTAACIIATGFCTCENRAIAVVLLSLAVMFMGIGRAGYLVNHVDFAPKYAGVLYGITNTAATVPGMVAPLLAGHLAPNNTSEEWRQVFYVCGGFAMFGMLMFTVFASGEIQDWAKDGDKEIEVPQVNNFDTDAENYLHIYKQDESVAVAQDA